MKSTQLITRMAVLVAIGTLSSHLLAIPTGVAKAFPIQHAINVIAAVLLGPVPAVMVAFTIALLRNLLGIGTLLAFPGGMIGALLAGFLYSRFKRTGAAALGELVGTGVIASLISVPFAGLFMGKSVGALAFLPSFLASSLIGAAIGWTLIRVTNRSGALGSNGGTPLAALQELSPGSSPERMVVTDSEQTPDHAEKDNVHAGKQDSQR